MSLSATATGDNRQQAAQGNPPTVAKRRLGDRRVYETELFWLWPASQEPPAPPTTPVWKIPDQRSTDPAWLASLDVRIKREFYLDNALVALTEKAPARLFIRRQSATNTPWRQAVRKAAQCQGYPGSESETFLQSNADRVFSFTLRDVAYLDSPTGFGAWNELASVLPEGMPVPRWRATQVKIGHHAALLLLRQELVRAMNNSITASAKYADSQNHEYVDRFIRKLQSNDVPDTHPFMVVTVTDPNQQQVPFGMAGMTDAQLAAAYPSLSEIDYMDWRRGAVREGARKIIGAAARSAADISTISDCDTEELVEISALGLGLVARKLEPRLFTNQPGANAELTWVRDEAALRYVGEAVAMGSQYRRWIQEQRQSQNLIRIWMVAIGFSSLAVESTSLALEYALEAVGAADLIGTLFQFNSEQTALERSLAASFTVGTGRYLETQKTAMKVSAVYFNIFAGLAIAAPELATSLYSLRSNAAARLRQIEQIADTTPRLPPAPADARPPTPDIDVRPHTTPGTQRPPIDPTDTRPRLPRAPADARPPSDSDVVPLDPSDVRPLDPSDVRPIDPSDVKPIDPSDVQPLPGLDD